MRFYNWIQEKLLALEIEITDPATEADVSDFETKCSFRFPEDYRELLLFSNGLTVYGNKDVISFYTLEDLFLVNDDPIYSQHLEEGIFIIANDNGDSLYVYDRSNVWKHGSMGLYRMDAGSLKRYSTQYLGADLKDVLLKIRNGVEFDQLPYLSDL